MVVTGKRSYTSHIRTERNCTPMTPSALASHPVTLRAATTDDVDAIATVWHDGWVDGHLGHVPATLHPHRRRGDFRRRVPAVLDATTVATTASGVVGLVMVRDDEVEQLYVDARARGGGTAAALLRCAERLIAVRFDCAWLAVVPGNTRARRFYAREGWHDTGTIEHPAPIANGSISVTAHRYEKRLSPSSMSDRVPCVARAD